MQQLVDVATCRVEVIGNDQRCLRVCVGLFYDGRPRVVQTCSGMQQRYTTAVRQGGHTNILNQRHPNTNQRSLCLLPRTSTAKTHTELAELISADANI